MASKCKNGIESRRIAQLEDFYTIVQKRAEENQEAIEFSEITCLSEISCPQVIKKTSGKNKYTEFKSLNGRALADAIENDLESDLNRCLMNRSASKILENGRYGFWHEKTKSEMKKLRQFFTSNQITAYMIECYHSHNKETVAKFMRKNSSLNKLLFKRELYRNNQSKFLIYNEKIYVEWIRISKILSPAYMVSYAFDILRSIRTEMSNV